MHVDGFRPQHWQYRWDGGVRLVECITARGERLWYIVTDQVGTPRELLEESGGLAWSNSPRLWGQQRLWQRPAANDDVVDCPLRFPGQYYDQESGLHYNRHRYYDPETAQYLSPDPLGLAGGARPQGYVDNPNAWIDPLGLAACPNPQRPGGYQTHDVDQHGYLSPGVNRAPRYSNIVQDNRVQFHHAIQKEWARINIPGYDPNAAPAILLPSSSGQANAQISEVQGAFRWRHGYSTDIRTEFNEAARQMRTAGVPESRVLRVLSQSCKYFDGLGAF